MASNPIFSANATNFAARPIPPVVLAADSTMILFSI